MTGEEGALQRGGGRGALQNDGGGGAPQNDGGGALLRMSSLSFRTAVRNLKSSSDGQPVPAMSWRASQHLRFLTTFGMTKGEGALQRDGGRGCSSAWRGKGAPQNDGGGGVITIPPLSFRTAVRNLKSPSDGQPVPAMSWRVGRHLRFLTTFGMTKGESAPRSEGGRVLFSVTGEGGALQRDGGRGAPQNDGGAGHSSE